MAKFILAEKKEMTQKFAENGSVIPVTKVVAGPCVITQIRDKAKDGYSAVQIGFGFKKNLSKALKGHLKDTGSFRYLKEFRIEEQEAEKLKVGDKITVGVFENSDLVKVTGTSKGKGFQGVVKRHGFHGSPASHGHKDQLRMPGSIGATGPAHVFKGTKMGGRMGGNQTTVSNLGIIEVNSENNEIFIKGAVPGARNNLLLISGVGDLVLGSPDEKEVSNKQNKQDKVDEEKPELKEEKKEAEPKAEKKEESTEEKIDKKEEKPESKAEDKKNVKNKKEDKK